jgi:hypothetical protein
MSNRSFVGLFVDAEPIHILAIVEALQLTKKDVSVDIN